MAVETTATSASFTGTGVSSTYAPGFYVNSSDQVVVTVDGVPQTLGDDYVVNNVGASTGCDIVGTFTLGSAIYVERVTPITQLVDTQNNETILEDVLDAEFDKLTMIAQELDGKADRAIKVPRGDIGFEVPASAARAGKMFAFGLDGFGAFDIDADKVRQIIAAVFTPVYTTLASLVMFLQAGIGAISRTVQDKLRERVSPDDFGAVGDGVADDTAAVNAAVTAIGSSGRVFLPAGKTYRVTAITNARNIGFRGKGVIVIGTGNAAYVLRTGRRGGPVYGRSNLYRLFARIGSAGTTLSGFLDGDSTMARGNTTVTGGVSGTTLTVSAVGNATLAPGTYVTSVSGTCQIVSQLTGTTFGNGTYQLSETGSIIAGSTINVGNGGGFAGAAGEMQTLLAKHFFRNGVRNAVSLINLAIGGSTWANLLARNRQNYLTSATDLLVVKAPVNKGANIATDIANMRAYFTALRGATFGRVDLLTIVLVGYSPAHDTTNGRTSLYAELMFEACLQCVEDFDIVFLDLQSVYAARPWMVNTYLDAAGVHPGGFLQQQLAACIGTAMLNAHEAQLSTGDDWVTLTGQNSWVDYAAGKSPFAASLSPDGWVTLRGAVKSGTPTAGQAVALLPNTNYYPAYSIGPITCQAYNGAAWNTCGLTVEVDGRILQADGNAKSTFTSLDGIRFRVSNWG